MSKSWVNCHSVHVDFTFVPTSLWHKSLVVTFIRRNFDWIGIESCLILNCYVHDQTTERKKTVQYIGNGTQNCGMNATAITNSTSTTTRDIEKRSTSKQKSSLGKCCYQSHPVAILQISFFSFWMIEICSLFDPRVQGVLKERLAHTFTGQFEHPLRLIESIDSMQFDVWGNHSVLSHNDLLSSRWSLLLRCKSDPKLPAQCTDRKIQSFFPSTGILLMLGILKSLHSTVGVKSDSTTRYISWRKRRLGKTRRVLSSRRLVVW